MKLSNGLNNVGLNNSGLNKVEFGNKSGIIFSSILASVLMITPTTNLYAGSTKPTKPTPTKPTPTKPTKPKIGIPKNGSTVTINKKRQETKNISKYEGEIKRDLRKAVKDGYSINSSSGYSYNSGTNTLKHNKKSTIKLGEDALELNLCVNSYIGKSADADNIYKEICGKFLNINKILFDDIKEYGENIKKHNFTLTGDALKIVEGTKGALMTLFNAKKIETCSENYIGHSGNYKEMSGGHNFMNACGAFIKEKVVGVEHTLGSGVLRECNKNWTSEYLRQFIPTSYIQKNHEDDKEKFVGKKVKGLSGEAKIERYIKEAVTYYRKKKDYHTIKNEGTKYLKLLHKYLPGISVKNYGTAEVEVNCNLIRKKIGK